MAHRAHGIPKARRTGTRRSSRPVVLKKIQVCVRQLGDDTDQVIGRSGIVRKSHARIGPAIDPILGGWVGDVIILLPTDDKPNLVGISDGVGDPDTCRRQRRQPPAGCRQAARGNKTIPPEHIARGDEIIVLVAIIEWGQMQMSAVVVGKKCCGWIGRIVGRACTSAGAVIFARNRRVGVDSGKIRIAVKLSECRRIHVEAVRFGVGSRRPPNIKPELQQRQPPQLIGCAPAQPNLEVIGDSIAQHLERQPRRGQNDR